MILLSKNGPPKALCLECRHLYVPAQRELDRNQAVLCPPCKAAVIERSRSLNAKPRRKAV